MMLPVDYVGKCKEQSGKDLRGSLHKPSPNYGRKVVKLRSVPAFTIQAYQKNTRVLPPQRHIHLTVKPKPTAFRKMYEGGKIPFYIGYGQTGSKFLALKKGFKLDYQFYLPIFFEALAEPEYPYSFIVKNGIEQLIKNGKDKILPVVPNIIMPIKKVLLTRIPSVIIYCLELVQVMVKDCDGVGVALTPYYKHILPSLNLFLDKDRDIMYPRNRKEVMGATIEDTLHILESFGGPDAFINIKYMVPTYESYSFNH